MHDPQIQSFACGVLRVLASAGAGNIKEYDLEDVTRLTALIEYYDRSRLEVNVILYVSLGYVTLRSYSFHYMDGELVTIFRYDDADHHPELPDFPHHKHVGRDEMPIGYRQPSARAIRNEIEAHLNVDRLSSESGF